MHYKRLKKTFKALAIILSLCVCSSTISLADTANNQTVLNYLNNWSYIDGETTYTLDVSAMTPEELSVFFTANPDDIDSIIHDYLKTILAQQQNVAPSVLPCVNVKEQYRVLGTTTRSSGEQYELEEFTYDGGSGTKEYTWEIKAAITSDGTQVTSIGNTTCNINVVTKNTLTANNLTKTFALIVSTHASVCYSVKLTAQFGYVVASKWKSLVYNFYP